MIYSGLSEINEIVMARARVTYASQLDDHYRKLEVLRDAESYYDGARSFIVSMGKIIGYRVMDSDSHPIRSHANVLALFKAFKLERNAVATEISKLEAEVSSYEQV